jgi:hypothetical protein
MASKAKYNGFIGAAQVSIDQARARGEERVTLPMTWAGALNDYATALRVEQEIAAASARSNEPVSVAQLEAKVAALTAELDNSKKIVAVMAQSAIANTRRDVQLASWLENSQSEEHRLRKAHYDEQQRAEGLAARAKMLQTDNDRLQDEAKRWEDAYRVRGELLNSQQDDIMHWVDRFITLSKQVEADAQPCVWKHDPGGMWLTGCGSVADRYAPFCPYCGHKVEKL